MSLLQYDFSLLFCAESLLAIGIGTLFGMIVGALPGLGPSVGCALLIPITYTMNTIPAVLLLIALYQGAEYGGSISSIILGVPGTAAAVATELDGNAMAKKGMPGKALGYSLYASTIGGLIGCVILMTLTLPLMQITIKFSDPELCLISLLGLVSIIMLGSEDAAKSVVAVSLGLLITSIGMDMLSGVQRYTFGTTSLLDGIALVPMLTGLFAISEVLNMVCGDLSKQTVKHKENLKVFLTLKETLSVFPVIIKSALIGTFAGIVPGMGASPASWLAYTEAKRTAKKPELFGRGAPAGIAAPESANNACVAGALVPLLTLGIPGSGTIAVVSSALIMQGIQPGPNLLNQNVDLVFSIFWGLLLATCLMWVLGRFTTSMFATLLVIPNYILATIIFTISLIGAFAARRMMLDVWIAIIAGVVGFFMKKLKFSTPAFVLAFVLGSMIEKNFRRSLMLSRGSYMIFVSRPFALICLLLNVLMIVSIILRRRKAAAARKMQSSQL
jgi:putative tricarboxylic transport membrane protein